MYKTMSPVELDVLMHFYWDPETRSWAYAKSTVHGAAVAKWRDLGLLNEAVNGLSPKGLAFVSAILSTPVPEAFEAYRCRGLWFNADGEFITSPE